MEQVEHADGDILSGLRGLGTSIISNSRAALGIVALGAVAAPLAWGFLPKVADLHFEPAASAAPLGLEWVVLVVVGAVLASALPVVVIFQRDDLTKRLVETQREERAEIIVLLNSFLSPTIEKLPLILDPKHGLPALEQTPEGRLIRGTDTIGVPMASDREINCPSAGKSLSVYKEAVMSACN